MLVGFPVSYTHLDVYKRQAKRLGFSMSAPAFTRLPHPNPTADDVRAAAISDPVFGRVFTDHMVSIRYKEGQGWHLSLIHI